ncbi:MAG: alpha/beta hydrolase [Phenylobacterium sp.]|nr:MAG: alpha/beta hydrolase [Phenylobacterium sp.]
MTRFLMLRTHDVGGAVVPPSVVDCDGVAPLGYQPVTDDAAAADVAGRDVVLAIHGFNVPRPHGVGSLAALEAALALTPNYRFFGVLWPGDFWIPVIDYPWEAAHAVTAGRYLATYLNQNFTNAASISFISHSLGGRVLLEAVQNLDRPAPQLCIAAGAADDDCMVVQYQGAKRNAGRICVLSSTEDMVLKLAYPAGDFISDVLLGDNDSPWESALGLKGPKPDAAPPIFEEPIPSGLGYGHGDYFPPSTPPVPPPADPKWRHAVDYMRRAITGQASYWA